MIPTGFYLRHMWNMPCAQIPNLMHGLATLTCQMANLPILERINDNQATIGDVDQVRKALRDQQSSLDPASGWQRTSA